MTTARAARAIVKSVGKVRKCVGTSQMEEKFELLEEVSVQENRFLGYFRKQCYRTF
jgi:hypothetical protein